MRGIDLVLCVALMLAAFAPLPARAQSAGAGGQRGPRTTPAVTKIWYVTPTGNDSNGGHNWGAALRHVQTAINDSIGGDQIWVKQGTYYENITLKASTSVYGGFNGTEVSLGQRDWITNVTILDGSSNGTSVVSVPTGTGITTTLDGFTVQHGAAPFGVGGGVTCAGAATLSNCIVTNNRSVKGGAAYNLGTLALRQCTVTANTADGYAGAIYQGGGACTVLGSTFTDNNAMYDGAAIWIDGGFAEVTQCVFQGNSAVGNGGAISSISSSATPSRIADNLFLFNSATGDGGAMVVGGNIVISNNTFTNNSSGSGTTGGGISVYGGAQVTIANNILTLNSSGILLAAAPAPTLGNNCVYGNSYFNYSGLAAGSGDISVDPKFIDGPDGDYHLLGASPCVNAGNNSYVMTGDTDLDGLPRIAGATVDMGCYEFSSLQTVTGTITLQGAVNPKQTLTFTFRPTGGSPAFPRSATLDTGGNFTLTNVPPLPYTVAIVGPRYLNKDVSYTVTTGANTGLDATLLVGDINGDNVVDIADFGQFAPAYGTDPTSPDWNPDADLNNDGKVDIADFGLLTLNFGATGDP